MFRTKLRTYFITGLIIVLPLLISVGVTAWIFVKLTDFIFPFFPEEVVRHPITKLLLRAFGIVIAFMFLTAVGVVARNYIGQKLFRLGELILVKIPLFNKVYVAVKQVSQAFLVDNKTIFKKVVIIEYPRKGLYSLGFVTSDTAGEVQVKTKEHVLNVFVPTTPNPTSGVLIMVPAHNAIALDMSVEDGLKLVISGGSVVPEYVEK